MSLRNRKIILWLTVILLAIILLFVWGKSIPERVQGFSGQEFFGLDLPEFKMPGLPEINLEELNGQETATTTEE